MKDRKNIWKIIWSIILWALAVQVNAVQSKAFDMIVRPLPHAEQLPTKELLCIFQDSEGYMWYGTEGGGLCRDDGYTVKVFRSDFRNPGVLESNSVTCMAEDREGKIWFGTKRGVYFLSKSNYEITPLADEKIKGWNILTMKAASDGMIWISANGHLFRYDASGKRTGTYILPWKDKECAVNSIYEDKEKRLWVTQTHGGLWRYDAAKDKFVSYPWPYDAYPTGMTEDKDAPFCWIATWGKGIVRFDPAAQRADKMFKEDTNGAPSGSDSRKLHHIVQDSVRGYLWVTAADNLYAYEITPHTSLDRVDVSRLLSPDKKILNKILSDPFGNLWITGYYPSSFVVSFLPDEVVSLPMEEVRQTLGVTASPMQFSHEKDYYWIRQRKRGLYVYHPQKHTVSMIENDKELSFFFEEPSDREGVYVVRGRSVLWVRYDGHRLLESVVCTLPIKQGERIRALHDDRHGNLWIGTTYHLFCYGLKNDELATVCDEAGFINAITSSGQGDIYFATESKGLWKISEGRKMQIKDTGENYSLLTVCPNGNVWIGTQQGNVYGYAPETNDFVSRTKDCGLTGDVIQDMKADDDGNLWILTSQRATIYRPDTHVFTMMACTDSWINLEEFQSLYKGVQGEMSIGGRGGIVVFPHYTEGKKKAVEPRVRLTAISINGRPSIGDDHPSPIRLSPDERPVELSFSTFNLLNTGRVRYAYRYHSKADWTALPIGENRINLTDLSKGMYDLEVRATDENGQWGERTLTVRIQCLPAWYETGWAYLCYALVVLTIAFGGIRLYLRSRRTAFVPPVASSPVQMPAQAITAEASKPEKEETNTLSASDEQLIKKVQEMVEKHLAHAEYSIEDLSKDLGMSRATLYRKITSITGGSPSDFMKNVRLRKAAELLKAGGLSIAEIAERVGFNTPGYFTKSFKKLFGVLPTQYK